MIVSGREEMSENPSEEAEIQLDLRYQLTAEVAKGYSNAGFTVIVQDNYYGEKLDWNEMAGINLVIPLKGALTEIEVRQLLYNRARLQKKG